MSTKGNKELIRQVIKDRNEFAGDAAKVRSWCEKYCAPGYIHHNLVRGDLNREQMMQYFVTLMSAFPDFNKSIDDMVAEGDKTVIRCTVQATHKGTFMGIPATGKRIVVKAVEIDKIVGGKIIEAWGFSDSQGMMNQLGVVPGAASKT